MELSEKTGEELVKIPRDILKYIWAFNHRCSLLKKEKIYIVIRYEEIKVKFPLHCLKYHRNNIGKNLEILEESLKDIKVPGEICFPGSHIFLAWKKGKYFMYDEMNLKIELPKFLIVSILKILKARMELEVCDCCGKLVQDM